LGNTAGATVSSHVNIGFDAITVALLGGSSAPGILLAGLLFGAFIAGSPAMQLAGVSGDVLTIVQASIVLFIAAPPLVRAIFRLPKAPAKASTEKADEDKKERALDE
jgi:simple sugar transport system permease protein